MLVAHLAETRVDVVNRLSAAESNRQLAREIKHYQSPKILLIDELGYMPLDKRGAELLFQVISKRYERGSIIITTNIAFKDWPRIFAGDATLTSALLDSSPASRSTGPHRRRQLPQRQTQITQPVPAYATETSPVHF